eukprot:gene29552-39177_t
MDNSVDASRPVRAKKTKYETTTKDSDTSQWPTKKKKKKLSGPIFVEASSNAVTTPSQLPVVLPTNLMKIKRLSFAESKNGTSQFNGPIKRPRGRPPLPTNRLKTGEKTETITASSSSAASVPSTNPPKYTPLKGKVSTSASHKSKSHSKSLKSRPTIVPYLGTNGIASYSNSSQDNRNNFVNDNSSNKILESGHPTPGEKHSKSAAGTSSTSVTGKGSRPPASAVVHRVLSLLSVSDPISLTDLNAIISDAPKDLLQAVMDVLRVLGLVIYLKPVESSSSAFSFSSSTASSSSSSSSSSSIVAYPPSSSSSSSSFPVSSYPTPPPLLSSKAAALTPTGGGATISNVYALAEFAKGFSAIELNKIEEDIALKVTEIEALRERNAALQKLTGMSTMSKEERLRVAREVVTRSIEKSPSLSIEPLYASILTVPSS